MSRVSDHPSGLVDIVRDFLDVHRLTRRMIEHYRAGDLRFDEVARLVGDSEQSALFRLKERCHALFRASQDDAPGSALRPEALFDLAVGALFHDAMKLRENFYQLEVYGPKVRTLRQQSGDAPSDLVREMEKVLAAASERFDEALAETEMLLVQTREQFRLLLVVHRDNGLVARYLVENASLVSDVFGTGIDSLLAGMYGDAATGYVRVARSYLRSGYFEEAGRALAEAIARTGESDREELHRLEAYAEGMKAYLSGHYSETVEKLGRWVDAGPSDEDAPQADLAYAAVSRIGQLVEGPSGETVARQAAELAERIKPYSPRARV